MICIFKNSKEIISNIKTSAKTYTNNNNTTNQINNNDLFITNRKVNYNNLSKNDKMLLFSYLNLPTSLVMGISIGISPFCTRIQAISLRPMLDGKDVILQSQTGSGKTVALCIALSNCISYKTKRIQALSITPTREHAIQIRDKLLLINSFTNHSFTLCIGGRYIGKDLTSINSGVFGLVGTAGRIVDLVWRHHISLTGLKILSLDEIDVLLNKSFIDPIDTILNILPKGIQTVAATATLSLELQPIISKFMREPVIFRIRKEETAPESIQQLYTIHLTDENKLETLYVILESILSNQSLIFCNTIMKSKWLYNKLLMRNFDVALMHGKMIQKDRAVVFSKFNKKAFKFLVATDLMCRSIDFLNVSTVINFDFPINKEAYIHRMGRTGRFGKNGVVFNLITNDDEYLLKSYSTYYSMRIEPTVIEETNKYYTLKKITQ
mmetsp:Transcript_6216/g.8590  ORF Transcript_6216/g.8590 Transcript_6216/m.8590 type:complete len:438 (+) Transcript_6216:3-1316(+)